MQTKDNIASRFYAAAMLQKVNGLLRVNNGEADGGRGMKTCDTCGQFQTSELFTRLMILDGKCVNPLSPHHERYMASSEGCEKHSDNED